MVKTSPLLALIGGSGYVGGRLLTAAVAAGWQVRVLARPGRAPQAVPSTVDWLGVDWRDPAAARSALAGCAAAVQLAAANEIDAAADPVAAVRQTVEQALAWARAAREAVVPRLLQCSTAHVHGAPEASGAALEEAVCRPVHPYGALHLAAEECLRMVHRRGDLRIAIVRLANVVGAPQFADVQRWTLLANDLARQAVERGRMVLATAGLAVRDFVPMADACAALLHVLALPADQYSDGAEAGLFQVGGGAGRTVLELAQQLHGTAERVLARAIVLEVPAAPPGSLPPPPPAQRFHLSLKRLLASGWRPGADTLSRELEALLGFCQRHFGLRVGRP